MMLNLRHNDSRHYFGVALTHNFMVKGTTMKRILLVFDGKHFSDAVFEYARQLNEQQPIWLTGLFLPSVDYVELLYSYGGVISGPLYVTEIIKGDDEFMQKAKARFIALCDEHRIAYDIPTDFSKHTTAQIAEASRFADLLVLSSHSFYKNLGDDTREEYIADALHQSECPVVLIPDNYRTPDSLIIAYDGGAQAVFAMKQFAYLFPALHKVPALIAYFETKEGDIPNQAEIEKLASLHFEHATVRKMPLNPKQELEAWVAAHGPTLLIAGSHSRSMLSEMFKGSFINEVVHQHKVPVFVAHK